MTDFFYLGLNTNFLRNEETKSKANPKIFQKKNLTQLLPRKNYIFLNKF